jgi:hypothetical protein
MYISVMLNLKQTLSLDDDDEGLLKETVYGKNLSALQVLTKEIDEKDVAN